MIVSALIAARLLALAPEIDVAADLAGLSPAVLSALLVVETRVKPLEGQREPVAGIGQIRWSTWAPWLAGEGLSRHDAMDPGLGVLAAGTVLAGLRAAYGPMTTGRLLCLYSCGSKALNWTDCTYSRAVMDAARELGSGVTAAEVEE